MIFHAQLVFLLLYLFPTTPTADVGRPAYTATDLILLSCGDSRNSNDISRRTWEGDELSRYAPSDAATISSASAASRIKYVSEDRVPYKTARVFHSPFTYIFPVSPGQKFLRLYFYPDVYNYNTSLSLFSLTANSFTLLSSFSAFLYSKNTSQPSFIKEFIINIDQKQRLRLTFSPNTNSFAFVNGIEIVSVPDKLYFKGNDVPIKYVDRNMQMYLENYTALENLYRLNVGGSYVSIEGDSGPKRGMFRAWSWDDDYILEGDNGNTPHLDDVQIKYTPLTPAYSAPSIVYTSGRVPSNYSVSLKWGFSVDSGFMYLLRFHFCEFRPQVVENRQRVFSITINDYPAETQFDVIDWAGGTQIPIFRDYMTWVPDDGYRGKKQLRLSLFAEFDTLNQTQTALAKFDWLYQTKTALLNGLEIFKLNNSHGSLAAANPTMEPFPSTLKVEKKGRRSLAIYAATGSVIGVLVVVGVLSFFIYHKVKKKKPSHSTAAKSSWLPLSNASTSTTSSGKGASHPSKLCRYFSLQEIKNATSNLDRNFIIGKGGFGCVYRGNIDNGTTTVAIKRLNPSSNQGVREFLTEIQMLSKLRHLHLVSLIGYCDEDGEMILVYDYMANGSLCDHLYKSENSALSWKQRLQICMGAGAAKGLHYLHTGAEHTIIHRDVKSTNILLDENWVAKISDFGLSKMGEANDSFTHISTNVKGTFGYLDPKYLSTHRLTRKSDVYAFGVVLFEVLSGRPAVDVRLDEEQHSLAGWARFCVREGEVDRLIDTKLVGQISAACLQVFVGIAGRSIHIQPLERPTMADVVMGLELALALQESTYSAQQEEKDDDDDVGKICSDRSEVGWHN